MKELKAACQKHGIKFGFYYSQAWEWHHPDTPGNDWEHGNPGGDKRISGPALVGERPQVRGPRAQLRRRQGHPPGARADRQVRSRHHLVRHARAAAARGERARAGGRPRGQADPGGQQPHRASRSRAARPPTSATTAPPPTSRPSSRPTRARGRRSPPPTSPTAGTRATRATSRPGHFIELLAKASARGGNVLLNVGPMGNGKIDPKDVAILEGVGAWMKSQRRIDPRHRGHAAAGAGLGRVDPPGQHALPARALLAPQGQDRGGRAQVAGQAGLPAGRPQASAAAGPPGRRARRGRAGPRPGAAPHRHRDRPRAGGRAGHRSRRGC